MCLRDQQPEKARRRETGDVQLSRIYAYLHKEEKQRNVYGAAADDPQEGAGKAERGESRASATHARNHPRTRQMVASGGAWPRPVLRRAHESQCAVAVSVPGRAALASRAVAAQPERSRPLGTHAAPHPSLVAASCCLSSLSSAPHGRHYLRQEPDAVVPLVRDPWRGCVKNGHV